jgi:hypothetical protein
MNHIQRRRRPSRLQATRPSLSLITTPPATPRPDWETTDAQTHVLQLSFGELALIYKSLQAVKTLGAFPPQDELLNDTLRLVDQALNRAV